MSEYKLTFLYKKGLDYKTRNLIILIVLFVFTLASAILINRSLVNTFMILEAEKQKLDSELSTINQQIASAEPLRQRLSKLREELFLTDMIMPDKNNSTITLAYIFDIFNKYGNHFFFNYRVINSGKVDGDQEVGYNRYQISGEAYINLLYVFIDQFERQPAFFTIESIEFTSLPADKQGKVGFSIEVNAFFTSTGTDHTEIKLKDLKERKLVNNIFYPRIYEPFVIDSDEFRELLDVSEIVVVGLTPDRVFIRNRRTGLVDVLYIDDPIRYGKLSSIDWNKQEAVFRINPSGLAEEVRIKISPQ